MGSCGTGIVARALDLAGQHPEWPALQVLDAAMDGHVNTHPDFDTGGSGGVCDWLDPPSEFAALVRSAIAPDLAQQDFTAESERWQEVIEKFAQRYRLWC